jgi:hypothetical protein
MQAYIPCARERCSLTILTMRETVSRSLRSTILPMPAPLNPGSCSDWVIVDVVAPRSTKGLASLDSQLYPARAVDSVESTGGWR